MTHVASQTVVLDISDPSQISHARMQVGQLAHTLGFDEIERGRVEIIVTELATNIILHARAGQLLVRRLEDPIGIEILAVDRGPGMTNVSECLRDGFSTAGTAGNGLGAIRRLAQVFDLYTRPQVGTVVLAHALRGPAPVERFVVGGLCIAVDGEVECGDLWSIHISGPMVRVCMGDGLGHGPDAALAVRGAILSLASSTQQSLTVAMETAHRAIAGTRGAAVAVCAFNADAKTVQYLGIGNISGVLIAGNEQHNMVSLNGIVGHQQHKRQEFAYSWRDDHLLIMHSDGLRTPWSLEAYPGLVSRHPSVIAAVLHRDHCRGRDDVGIVIVREA